MPALMFKSPPETEARSPDAVLECPPEMHVLDAVARLSKPPRMADHVPWPSSLAERIAEPCPKSALYPPSRLPLEP